jgi:hypothetical protein
LHGAVGAAIVVRDDGIATPTRDVELIRARLQEAARMHAAHEGG